MSIKNFKLKYSIEKTSIFLFDKILSILYSKHIPARSIPCSPLTEHEDGRSIHLRGGTMIKHYFFYLLHWQLATPIIAVCVAFFVLFGNVLSTVIANLTGGLIFFWIDRIIFSKKYNNAVWNVKSRTVCVACGREGREYRLVESGRYNKTGDEPQYRCEACSVKKAIELSRQGGAIS